MGKAFHTAHGRQVERQDDIDVLTLGHGVQVKLPHQDPQVCVVFASVRGPSSQHRYEGSPAGDI